MPDPRAAFARAVAELGRQACALAEEDDADVRLSRAALDAALRAAEDLATAAHGRAASRESYAAAARAVSGVAARIAAERARRPRRLAVFLRVDALDEGAVS